MTTYIRVLCNGAVFFLKSASSFPKYDEFKNEVNKFEIFFKSKWVEDQFNSLLFSTLIMYKIKLKNNLI